MGGMVAAAPLLIPEILSHVGLMPVLGWMRHVFYLALYTLLHLALGRPLRALLLRFPAAGSPRLRLRVSLACDAWEFGSGMDYEG